MKDIPVTIHLDQTPKSSLLVSRYKERLLDVKYMSILAKALRNSSWARHIYFRMDKKWKFDLFMMRQYIRIKQMDLEKPNDFQYDKKTIIENWNYLRKVGWLSSLDDETRKEYSKEIHVEEPAVINNSDKQFSFPKDWKSDSESIYTVFETYPHCLEIAPKSIRKDKDLMLRIIQSGKGNPETITKLIDQSFLKEREFAIYALKYDSSIEFLLRTLHLDKEMLKIIANRNAFHFPTKHDFRYDREFMEEMLECGVSFEKFDESIQDMEIVKKSLPFIKFPISFSFIKLELRKDRELTKMALEINSNLFRYIYFEFKSDLEIALLAIRKDPSNLQFMSNAFKNNPEIILPALEISPTALQFVDPSCENYHDIVIDCVKRDSSTFRHVIDQSPYLPHILSVVPEAFHYIHADVHGTERFPYLEYVLEFGKYPQAAIHYSMYKISHLLDRYPAIVLHLSYIHEDYLEKEELFEYVCRNGNLKHINSKHLMNRELMLKIFHDFSLSDLQPKEDKLVSLINDSI